MTAGLPRGISVVVPAFRSSASLVQLVGRVEKVLATAPHEIIIIDDGSPAATWETITRLSRESGVVGVRLSRNSGQQAALLAGIRLARFDLTVTMDDDLQNPPEEIPRLIDALENDNLDLVYGYRSVHATARWRSVGSGLLKRLLSLLLRDIRVQYLSPFRVFRTRIRDAAAHVSGPRLVLDGLLHWGTDRVGHVEVEHHRRLEGRSGYGYRQLFTFALDVVTGYSTKPLRATAWLGFLSAGFGLGVLVYVVGQYFVRGTGVAGFPFLASIVALFAGAQLVALGVIGEYLARMHVRILGQPTYVIAEVIGGRVDADPTPQPPR